MIGTIIKVGAAGALLVTAINVLKPCKNSKKDDTESTEKVAFKRYWGGLFDGNKF